MNPVRIAIHGAAGRMGRRLVALAQADPAVRLVAALESPSSTRLGEDAGLVAGIGPIGLKLSAQLEAQPDIVIDFSVPAALDPLLQICLERDLGLVLATTGLDAEQQARVRAAAQRIAVVWSPNMSLAVNLTMKLAQIAATALADMDADVEILEHHHRFKEDAPSGTALKLGQIVAAAMGQTAHRHGRQGRPGPRPHAEIGYHAIRAGDDPGQHTILFAMQGEAIELTVRATNRDCYARGALSAAKYLLGKPPGLYGIEQVLGL
ncbi:MAG: 4-hydroxy-tetrahydrodipicolinate reductase [Thermoguttaceae bacterium]